MNVGEKYTLAWKMPHRIECEIVAFEPDYVVFEAQHRCAPTKCKLQAMRTTLPIHGEMRFRYDDFAKLFVQLNADAIALPPAMKGVA